MKTFSFSCFVDAVLTYTGVCGLILAGLLFVLPAESAGEETTNPKELKPFPLSSVDNEKENIQRLESRLHDNMISWNQCLQFCVLFKRKEVEAEVESALKELRIIVAGNTILPDSILIILMRIVYADFKENIQEMAMYTLEAAAKNTTLPEEVEQNIKRIIQGPFLPLMKVHFLRIVKQQIQNHSQFFIEIQVLNNIISNDREMMNVRSEALSVIQAYAEKKPLPFASVFHLENIIQDKSARVYFRKNALDTFVKTIQSHPVSERRLKAFVEIIKDKKQEHSIRSSLMLAFVKIMEHQSLPNFFLRDLRLVIYDNTEKIVVRRIAIGAFISIVNSPGFHADISVLEILKYIVRENKISGYINVNEAGITIKRFYSSGTFKKPSVVHSVWEQLKKRCQVVF